MVDLTFKNVSCELWERFQEVAKPKDVNAFLVEEVMRGGAYIEEKSLQGSFFLLKDEDSLSLSELLEDSLKWSLDELKDIEVQGLSAGAMPLFEKKAKIVDLSAEELFNVSLAHYIICASYQQDGYSLNYCKSFNGGHLTSVSLFKSEEVAA
tara:strand:+ start:277 stop:732 length:456 start_codon:yes stop_codon:yes gene_type:complete